MNPEKDASAILALEEDALEVLLGLIDRDITAGRRVGDLPPRLLAEMRRAMTAVHVDLNEELEPRGER